MRIYIYGGGEKLVGRSGVGQAIRHQRECLRRAGIETASHWTADAAAVHVNTVLPDSVLTALLARLRGKRVVWYGHSTMEDFRGSFKGSDAMAPLFRQWIRFCYGLGDVVLTPTEYSRRLLEGYGLKRPVYSISNGVDTDYFRPDPAAREAFRRRYGLEEGARTVISVGHTIARKGLPEFLELARRIPSARFFWFGWTDPRLSLLPRLRGPGAAAGGLLRRGCVCLYEPRGDRGHCGAGGSGLRHPHGGAGHPRLQRLAGGRQKYIQSVEYR